MTLTTIAQAATETAAKGPLAPQAALVIIILALVAGYVLFRLSHLETLQRFRPYIVGGLVILWGLAVVEMAFAIAHALTVHWLSLGLFLLGTIVLTNFEWLRNIMAGLAIAFERRIQVGDSVRLGEIEGEIQSFQLRAVRVRGIDGRAHEIPNRKFVDESVSNLASEGDSACDVTVSIPKHLSPQRARQLGREAALMTPLASPRHKPEVFVEADENDDQERIRLRVRGYAFDPAYQERYRSDVTSRLLAGFEELSDG